MVVAGKPLATAYLPLEAHSLCCCGDRWRNRATPPPNTIFIILAPNDMDNVVAYILSLKD